MQSRWLAIFLSGAALLLGANSAFARHSLNFSSDGKISTCDDFESNRYDQDDGGVVSRAQEEHALTAADAKQIDVTAYRNGGISVIGWEKPDAEVLVCKAAVANSKADADGLVQSLKANISGGTISGSGPEDVDTWMYFIVRVPTGASVSARSTNGPIEVRGTNGSLDAEARNGPIALGSVRGTIKARTQNGPIAFTGSSGDVQLTTQNGPIAVSFDQTKWEGKGLEAHVQNGPLSIAVPANYSSGVEITTSGHAPIVCASCEISSNYGRETIHLGAKDAPVLVRLSTVNGPVNIAGPHMF
jgi:hypothetical protein